MIYIKENTLEKISKCNSENTYVLTDFDRTLTKGSSDSSWSILSKSEFVPKEYVEKRQEYYNYYRPIEIDEKLDYETKNKKMSEWWNKHINLFVKYKLKEEVINNAANDLRVMSFRNGTKEFLESMHKRKIPVIIISAGIGNFIKQFLIKNNCDFDNIFIVSNFIKFENGIAIGVKGNITHSLNKNAVYLPNEVKNIIKNRNNIVLLGDQISDILMAKEEDREKVIKIGFLEEKVEENKKHYFEAFDIVCTDNTGFGEIKQKIKNG